MAARVAVPSHAFYLFLLGLRFLNAPQASSCVRRGLLQLWILLTVLQQGYKVGMSKGLHQAPSPVLTWRGVCSSREVGVGGSCRRVARSQCVERCVPGVVQCRVVAVAGHVGARLVPSLCPAQ